ncbi:MAG: hypothetical protein AMJ90_06070 [candidate division Zixibacteria bacterium SM23_73_2]|nr:MAG: hypothetical protein AMJ90_06070 [candidate division Zixibacteria bacterium SM23_73_2]
MASSKKISFLPVDLATLLYLLVLSFLVLIFSKNNPHWLYFIILNFSFILVIFLIIRFLRDETNLWQRFFRHWYPALFFTFLYEETGGLVHTIFGGWFDPFINSFELELFGVYPSVWFQKLSCLLLDEYMMLAYFSYYFLLALLGAILYFKSKIKEFDKLIFSSAVAFYISYLGFILFPVQGPRYQLAGLYDCEIKGFLFTPLAQWVVNTGGLHGGCMPSSHCAVAFVVLVMAYRYHKILFAILAPIIISMFISTIYGRFHYFSDVAVGILIGIFSIWLCDRIYPAGDKIEKSKIQMVAEEMPKK